ncbi:alpha-ketoglutarate-dependent dioxygenase AlkB [Phenylobacterium sp.]|uniref:alpha-ketoglutarate-dependent dioxygenase AlkB n=1 Tax=Phenylobacterium sp. TaxID=1871053 RepID=UPI0027317D1D|nr:alpha-ketoglutarate-dependent dioxygenase AlkB [Phenylobacterium sp.]MDP1874468.1 alpha-ketoglutarate-dependent dioxygenase AlkB [Phenylobacterium sp.]MDP3299194.1 alpha-ketoglutarate-dependent dioxygenase AlkB [Phenylobacterium sp.]
MAPLSQTGFRLVPAALSAGDQAALLVEVLTRVETAPFYRPVTPGGKPMSVEMTNFGALGWVTDAKGYRYQGAHPLTGHPWPDIPAALLALWADLTTADAPPDACLVNLYRDSARMGLHQDRDEADFAFPVLSVSLGDTAVFRLGGLSRRDPTASVRLASGDACVLSGPARLAHHGIDRVLAGSSRLVPGGGRINLTLRRAGPAPG